MYAIVRTGGKQYLVRPGQILQVEKLAAPEGEAIELGEVLLVAADEAIHVGSPTVAGAKVSARVLAHGRGRKTVAGVFKAKTRYRRRRGHRQPFTRLAIEEIRLEPPVGAAEVKAHGS